MGVVCAVLYPSAELAGPCDSPDETDGSEGGGGGGWSVGPDVLRSV
jgi:hypothetical protein